jgi:hypothetical protein
MLHNIPGELRLRDQWVVAGDNKIPLNPRTGEAANVTDPQTWGTFEQAMQSGYKYVGFVLTHNDPYAIIDLDNKPDKPLTQEEWAVHQRILSSFDTYIERSASKRGYHIVLRGQLKQGRRRGNVEAYSAERYMIFTGDVVKNSPINDQQQLLDMLVQEMVPATSTVELVQVDGEISDADLVHRAMYAANGDKFTRLCNGEFSDYPSQSEADFALMSIIAYYTPDNAQVRRIFRMTALGKRDKAQRNDYLDYALSKIRAHEQKPVDLEEVRRATEQVLPPPPPPNVEPQAVPHAPNAKPIPVPKAPVALVQERIELPPGLVGEIAEYFYSSAIRPVREIALAAAIAVTAGVAGRAYNISGTGLNQYLILLAKTGSGKEGAMSGIENLMAAMRPQIPSVDGFLGPAAFSSGQALVKVLNDKPCFVSVLGEFGLTLQDISDQRATGPQKMLKKVLLDLYAKSGFTSVLRSSVYSDTEKNTKIVQAPNVTILGESTPETFFEGLDSSHIAEGLIPRFSIIEYTGPRPPRNRKSGHPPDAALLQRFSELVVSGLNMQSKGGVIPVSIDADALAVLDAFDTHADKLMNEAQTDSDMQLWNRAHLKALKLAALVAVGVNPSVPVVTADVAKWAIRFVERDITVISARFKQGDVGVGESKQISDLKRVIEQYFTLSEQQRKTYQVPETLFNNKLIPYSYLARKTVALASFRLDRVGATGALKKNMQTLMDSGAIVQMDVKTLQSQLGFQGVAYGLTRHW